MNWREAYPVVLCLSLITVLLVPQNAASAQGVGFVDIPLEAFHDEKSIELHGLISSQTLNIPIPQSWSPAEDSWIGIQMRVSPLLDTVRSSITVSLNGQLLISNRLNELTQSRQRLPIPANMLVKGNNVLHFTGTLYLPEDPQTNCQNWDDPSRWLVIEPGGTFHLTFMRENAPIDLASFPQGFIEPLETYLPQESRQKTLFVLPEVTTPDDLTSLSAISYVLGSYAGRMEDWQPEIISETQFSDRSAIHRNVIFIGHAPEKVQVESDRNEDFIALSASPWGVGNEVMIIGDQNREDGITPATILSDRTRSLLLQGNLAYVQPQPLPSPQPFLHEFTFEDLGYLDRTVKGIGPQSLIYRLYIPYEVEPVQVQLHLGLIHSPDLDLNNSSFTLYLNGFSVAGILPDPQGSAAGPVIVGLPARRLKPGVNFLRINFDLHLPKGSCERAPESAWATLLNTSRFEVSYRKHTPNPSLEYFPLPFSDPPGSLLVVPDQFHEQDLAHISKLSFMMGSLAGPDQDPPEVMTASTFLSNKSQHRNIILVGLPPENPVTLSVNDLLPQPFSEDGQSLQDGYGVEVPTTDRQASLGLLQILPSPWVRGGTLLVVTGNDPQGLQWTWDALLDPTLRSQFAGNLMVVGSDHRSQSSSGLGTEPSLRTLFQQIAEAGNIPIIGPLLQRYGQGFIGAAAVAIGSALLLSITVWWLLKVVRKRKASALVRKEELEEHE